MKDGAAPTATELRREIAAERERLVEAVGSLRAQVDRAKRLDGSGVPLMAGAALLGFVLGGGIAASLRLIGAREAARARRDEGRLARLERFLRS